MARISLRSYLREIDELIETHQYDQAIAHCRHILRYFPKNVQTYRLLGKAYLESQRYADASDILQRVLASVPDDFVSHVGMSIIREDEGNLDAAIWHMERAFEIQPANSAIQGELRRLHGRREGLEPPKIRLTRGALARMYLKGELYQQAIAELRAGLREDPDRPDLQVVLAQAYHVAGQKVDAADTCTQILKNLPYCLEANRILADILSQTERAREAQVYARRVESLDPYAAHLSPAAPTPDKVPDAAVSLEKLDWRPGMLLPEQPSQPEWASTLGVSLESEDKTQEALPEWLAPSSTIETSPDRTSFPPFTESSEQPSESPVSLPEDTIPDWMREAGWVPSEKTGEAESPPPSTPLADETVSEEPVHAEIPEWLQSIAPAQPPGEAPEPSPPIKTTLPESDETPPAEALPWLEETPPGPGDSVVTWLEQKPSQPPEETPYTLTSSDAEEIPEWLQDLQPAKPSLTPSAEVEESPPALEEAPTWMPEGQEFASSQSLEEAEPTSSAASAEALPDWLEELKAAGGPEAVPPAEELPAWLSDLQPAAEAPSAPHEDMLEIPEQEQANLPVESQPAQEPFESALEAPMPPTLAEEGGFEETEAAPSSGEINLDDEAAFAWLESLAAKQGVEEALLLSPEERRETPPEWVQEAMEAEAPSPEAGFSSASPPSPLDVSTEWMKAEAEQSEIQGEPQPPKIEAGEELPEYKIKIGEPEELSVVETVQPPATLEEISSPVSPIEPVPPIEAAEPSPESPAPTPPPPEEDMLFWPREAIRLEEQPPSEALPLEETPVLVGDTQPSGIKSAQEPLPTAIPPTEETPPTAQLEVAPEVGAAPVLPEWLTIGEEAAQEETVEAPSPPPGLETVPAELSAPQEEAFTWLENLAEGLESPPSPEIPEAETTPEWITQVTPEAPFEEIAQAESELPEWLRETPEEPGEETSKEKAGEEIPSWLKPPAILEETPPPAPQVAEEIVPELPSWLAGVEQGEEAEEPSSWIPSEELAQEPAAGLVEKPAPFEELFPEETAPKLDLNQVGLVDLERLPGIGFVKAQAILEYRQQHGAFTHVDELLSVPGITQEDLDLVRDRLVVAAPPEEEALEIPKDEEVILLQARNALVLGNVQQSLGLYKELISTQRLLAEVIHDLNEALYRFPVDVEIWETLGDAHARAGNLQNALDAYTKAEEYLH